MTQATLNENLLRLGTFNVNTLQQRGRKELLADHLHGYNIDIACIQETKLTRQGNREDPINHGYTLFYKGMPNGKNGVAIAVSRRLRPSFYFVMHISDRLMVLGIRVQEMCICIVSCYAPQNGCKPPEKNKFWDDLDRLLEIKNFFNILLIGGDLNGHVGLRLNNEDYNANLGPYGWGIRNPAGKRILNFARTRNLALTNTFFDAPADERITYYCRRSRTQLDFCLVETDFLHMITDSRAIPAVKVLTTNNGHRLVFMEIRLDPNITPSADDRTVDSTKLARFIRLHDSYKFCTVTIIHCMEPLSESSKEPVVKVVGLTKPGTPSFDNPMGQNTDVQQDVNLSYEDAENDYEVLPSTSKDFDLCAEHRTWIVERDYSACALGFPWQLFSQVRGINASDGTLITDPQHILERWRTYFSGIFNAKQDFQQDLKVTMTETLNVEDITIDEVTTAISQLNIGSDEKSTGTNQQEAELLHGCFSKIKDEGRIPSSWKTATVIPICKVKGDALECSSYQPIFLFCRARKLFENVLADRLSTIVKKQQKFRSSEEKHAVTTVKNHMKKYRVSRTSVHVVVLDLEQSFYQIAHDQLWFALRSHNVPDAYINLVQKLYDDMTGIVQCSAGASPFCIKVGITGWSKLSQLLVDIWLNTVMDDMRRPSIFSVFCGYKVFMASEQQQVMQDHIHDWMTQLQQHNMGLDIGSINYIECFESTKKTIMLNKKRLIKEPVAFLDLRITTDCELH